MEAPKGLGSVCLGLFLVVALAVVGGLFFLGVTWTSALSFVYIQCISQIALLLSIFVFLPLALFRATRIVAAFGLMAASYSFGACVWVFGLIVTWSYWGL